MAQPPWVSISGLAVWSTFTLWWTAVPFFPRLLLGSAAGYLELAAPWHRFYLPILLLLAAGIAQRALNLTRPSWNALLPATRLFINAVALGLQYPMIRSYPYVVVAPGGSGRANAYLAHAFNGSFLWGVLSWMWLLRMVLRAVSAPGGRGTVERQRHRRRLERNHLKKLHASTELL